MQRNRSSIKNNNQKDNKRSLSDRHQLKNPKIQQILIKKVMKTLEKIMILLSKFRCKNN